jgi:hypothetical protein
MVGGPDGRVRGPAPQPTVPRDGPAEVRMPQWVDVPGAWHPSCRSVWPATGPAGRALGGHPTLDSTLCFTLRSRVRRDREARGAFRAGRARRPSRPRAGAVKRHYTGSTRLRWRPKFARPYICRLKNPVWSTPSSTAPKPRTSVIPLLIAFESAAGPRTDPAGAPDPRYRPGTAVGRMRSFGPSRSSEPSRSRPDALLHPFRIVRGLSAHRYRSQPASSAAKSTFAVSTVPPRRPGALWKFQ